MASDNRIESTSLGFRRWLRIGRSVLFEIAAIALIGLAVLLVFREELANNSLYFENDTRIFYYPVMASLAEARQSGGFDQWTPHLLAGFPLFADGESGAFYPVNYLVLSYLPIEKAFVWLIVIRFFLAAVFMYAYARSIRLSRIAALAPAAVFSFGGFSVAQQHHMNLINSAAWLPLILFFFELSLRTRGYVKHGLLILAGSALAAGSLGVHIQVVLMTLLLTGIYVPYRIYFFDWRSGRSKANREAVALAPALESAAPDPLMIERPAAEVATPVSDYCLQPETANGKSKKGKRFHQAKPPMETGANALSVEAPDSTNLPVNATDHYVSKKKKILAATTASRANQPAIQRVAMAMASRTAAAVTVEPTQPGSGSSRRRRRGKKRRRQGALQAVPTQITASVPPASSRELARTWAVSKRFSQIGKALSKWHRGTVSPFLPSLYHAVAAGAKRLGLVPYSLGARGARRLVSIFRPANLGKAALGVLRFAGRMIARLTGKTTVAIWSGVIILVVGLGLAAAQLIPEAELANFSRRAGGVPYSFAVSYAMSRFSLVTLFFPFFFFDNSGKYWGLWSAWETAAYVGIMPFILALVALICTRSRQAFFFAAVAVLSILIAMGENAPWNLHKLIYQLPGFGQMRAPARFSFLFSFAMATLAGIGLQWLIVNLSSSRSVSSWPRLVRFSRYLSGSVFGLLIVLLVPVGAAIPFFLNWLSNWLRENRPNAMQFISQSYLGLRNIGHPMKAEEVFGWLQNSLSLDNKKVVVTVAFIVGSAIVLLLWDRFRRLGWLWRVAVIAVIAIDLYFFAKSFHPHTTVSAITAPNGASTFLQQHASEGRVFIKPSVVRDQSNRLLIQDVSDFGGYSSLQFQRHEEYAKHAEVIDNRLLDVANVRYVLRRNSYTPLPSFMDTSFHPLLPIYRSSSQNPGAKASFLVDNNFGATEVRIVGNLITAANIPQNAKLGEILVTDTAGLTRTVVLSAGVHLAEAYYDRPDLAGTQQHQKAQVAHTFSSATSTGVFQENLYFAKFPLVPPGKPPINVKKVEIRFTYPTGKMLVHGLSLADTFTWKTAKNLRFYDKERYRLVYQDEEEMIYENRTALPRAFLVPSVAKANPGMQVLFRMAEGDFDPEKMVLIEGNPDLQSMGVPEWNSGASQKTGADLGKVYLVKETADSIAFSVEAQESSFLFLADSYYPGWKAYIDNEPAEIYRANYLFRAVHAPKGLHLIEFRFQSNTFALGQLISLWTLPAVIGIALIVLFARLTAYLIVRTAAVLWR